MNMSRYIVYLTMFFFSVMWGQDTTPPELSYLSFFPDSINLNDETSIDFYVGIVDDISGIERIQLDLLTPSGNTETILISYDGQLEIEDTLTYNFSEFSSDGIWRVQYIHLHDLVWNDKVKGKISTSDKTIEWFQVSLKKGIDDARIGKIGDFLRMKYAKDGYSAQIDKMPTEIVGESILRERGNFLGVSYGFDDRIDQILLDEGLFDAFKGIVNKVKGSIVKLVKWASGKLRKIVGGAVKLARKVMSSNPVLDNVNDIMKIAGVKNLGEGYLVEKKEEPIKLSDGERTGILKRFQAFEKQLSSGMVNKEYDKIKKNVEALNAKKAAKFTGAREAVKLMTTDAAAKLDENLMMARVGRIIEKLENDDWKDGDLTTKDFFLLLKVASHYTAYNAINVILTNLLKNIKTHQHVVDAAMTFVADVKTEAKFGKTLLPLWIVYGHNGGSHYLATKSAFHAQAETDVHDVDLDQPYIVIQITPSKATAATYGLEGHNVTQLYLMSGLDNEGEKPTFKTKYLLLNFTTSSGSSFTMKPEVEKELIKEW